MHENELVDLPPPKSTHQPLYEIHGNISLNMKRTGSNCNNHVKEPWEAFCCWQTTHSKTQFRSFLRIPNQNHSLANRKYVFNSPAWPPKGESWYTCNKIEMKGKVRDKTYHPLFYAIDRHRKKFWKYPAKVIEHWLENLKRIKNCGLKRRKKKKDKQEKRKRTKKKRSITLEKWSNFGKEVAKEW